MALIGEDTASVSILLYSSVKCKPARLRCDLHSNDALALNSKVFIMKLFFAP